MTRKWSLGLRVQFRSAWVFVLLSSSFLSGQSQPMVVVPEIQYQRMEGFGVTVGNGASHEVQSLSQADQTKLLDLLFGADGARLNILRTEVWWTGKRLPFDSILYLRGLIFNFSDEENESSQYALIREAQRRNEVIINTCVWTPPAAWKSNNSPFQGGELLAKHFEDYADYLLGYFQYYKRVRNHDVQVFSLQNAPNQKLPAQSCVWRGETLRDFLKLAARRLNTAGFSPRFMLPETSWDQAATYIKPALEDAEARSMLSCVGVHSTEGENPARMQLRDLCKVRNLKLWQTEFAPASDTSQSPTEAGLSLAELIIRDLAESDCHAWLYWAPLSPSGWAGRRALFEKEGKTSKPTKLLWSLAQFSRFIPKDAVRISVLGNQVPAIVFRTPEYKGIVLVFVNPKPEPVSQEIELRGWTMERISAFRTSETEDCAQFPVPPQSGSHHSMRLEPKSITTVVAQLRRTRS